MSQFSMTTFYKYIFYLIINALVDISIREYSEISFTEDSDSIEARKLTGFCSIRVLTERHFRSVHSSKILLLNYFIFVYLFKLTIFSVHCPTLLRFTFFFPEISVNLTQYRVAIGVFNNLIFMTSKKHYYFSETSNMKNNFLFTTAINVMVLVLTCFMFKAFFNQKNLSQN